MGGVIMMCEKCGEIIPDNAKVCPSCGTVAGSAAETAEQESYDALRDAMNGVISPEEHDAAYREAVKPMTRFFWWDVCKYVVLVVFLSCTILWATTEAGIWRTIAWVAVVPAIALVILQYFVLKGLGPYQKSFYEAASNMVLGKFLFATFYHTCEGFAKLSVEKSPKLYSKWSGVFSSEIIMAIIAAVLYFVAIAFQSRTTVCWSLALTALALYTFCWLRDLVLLRKTIKLFKA